MNLTALKPKKANACPAEESDKSLALLVRLLGNKSEVRRGHLKVIRETGQAAEGLAKPHPKTTPALNFKKKARKERSQKKITFVQKTVIDKNTQLVAMPFQKADVHKNLILDKRRLLNHLKKKKLGREMQSNGRDQLKCKAGNQARLKGSVSPGNAGRPRKRPKAESRGKSGKGPARKARMSQQKPGKDAQRKKTKSRRRESKRRWV